MCHAYMHESCTYTEACTAHSTCVYIPVDDSGLQIAKLFSEGGKRKKKIMKKGERRRERDELKGIEKKENRKKEEALVVSIEYPANTFGTRSTNLYGMKHRMCRGYWTVDELETFF